MLDLERKLKLLKIAVGVIIVHLIMGIYQERILRQPYVINQEIYNVSCNMIANCSQEENSTLIIDHIEIKERFTYAFSYVGVQCFIYALIAKGAIMSYQHKKNETPQKYFSLPAIFYVLAMVTSNMALNYVPYTTQVIGKSSKPISVMFMSVLIAGKSYKPQKYVFVIVICFALILFTYKDKYNQKDGEDPFRGTALIGISLIMDGIMAALQDRMRSVSKPTSLNLMYFLNAWSSLYLAILLVIKGEGIEFVNFCIRHPSVLLHLGVLVIVGSLGQFLISRMISNFGALPLSIVMTIRKFITVFLSVIIYDNELSLRKWIAAGIIFLALIIDSVYQLKSSPNLSSSSSSSSNDTESTTETNSEENELKNKKNLNLSCVLINEEFYDTINGKQIEHENNESEACETHVFSLKIND
ncbi:hypothetical protein PVAND_013639 [Polypedilum vanderplanki]|uniref:Uncharacterized protein n=1 Tax=Polypedilum vanderplanki TaxID=319348 RepID=A0A9J6CR98_POLVA|nr:hypothetical protein PVAND_013639 [Polypedilum vanderplanki]